MATASASYRNSQPTPTQENRREQFQNTRILHRVCRDLEKLCEMGILEAFRDEHNIVRYRPIERAS